MREPIKRTNRIAAELPRTVIKPLHMDTPLVSVVIPVYNGSDYLREAVDSALAQTYPNVEVVVVNDGSTDDDATETIARSYGERIRYFWKTNGHVASALNFGIRHMRGEYFSWLSHDDVYLPDKIEAQMALALRAERPTAYYSDFATIDASGRLIEVHSAQHLAAKAVRPALMLSASIHGCTLLVPREAFDQVGLFNERLLTTQDYDLWLQMAVRYPFEHVPSVLVRARIHENQGTNRLRDHVQREIDALYRRYLPTLTRGELASYWPEGPFDYYRTVADSMRSRGYRGAERIARVMMARYLYDGVAHEIPIRLRRAAGAARNVIGKAFRRLRQSSLGSALRLSGAQAMQHVFTDIYRSNYWGNKDSRSGAGSDLDQTHEVRRALPGLLAEIGARSVLDIPCGDFHWMKEVALDVDYTGADIVEEMISRNQAAYGNERRRFRVLDLSRSDLPTVDLVFCRDVLVHFSFEDVLAALRNIKRSGSRYLLTTTFTGRERNIDIRTGQWRPINFEKPPFHLPKPLAIINEKCTEGDGSWGDKSLGLWKVSDL